MTVTPPPLERLTVSSAEQVADTIRAAAGLGQPVYPIGGGTSLDFGLPITCPGIGLDVSGLNQVIDYPAADMTITVQSGIRMRDLHCILESQRQQIPLDVPQAADATLGGVLATNFSGPRRLGCGTPRDYVIGIRAVDGRGETFAGGGRVVKNVAGYDFCRMLIGSLGTLAVITEVTLKLKPRPERRQAIVAAPQNISQLRFVLDRAVHCSAQPVGIEWLRGPAWQPLASRSEWPAANDDLGWLLVLLEGMDEEVAWMSRRIGDDWSATGSLNWVPLDADRTDQAWRELVEFPAGDAAVVLKGNLLPSMTVEFVELVCRDSPAVSLQAHAASGIVLFRLPESPRGGIGSTLVARWQPAATAGRGNLVVLRHDASEELTRLAVWGKPSGPLDLMRRIKDAFDPVGILNPGRFVY